MEKERGASAGVSVQKILVSYCNFAATHSLFFLGSFPICGLMFLRAVWVRGGEEKASLVKFHPQFSHSVPRQPSASTLFHDTSVWIFPRADVRAFHGERTAFTGQARKEGFPSSYSQCGLCTVLLLKPGHCERAFSHCRNSVNGRGHFNQKHFQHQILFFH